MVSRFCIGIAFLTALATTNSTARADDRNEAEGSSWVASWGAPMQAPLFEEPPVIENQTLRQVVHLSRGGSALRVRFSNVIGNTPLTIDAASIAVRADGAAVVKATLKPLHFAGASKITLPPHAVIESDAVALATRDESDLAISAYVRGPASATTQKTQALQTSYVSEPGDFTGNDSFTPARTITAWYWLSGVDVQRPRGRTIVAFGDSITEGYGSTTDQNCRWPDFLTRRLIAAGDPHSVIDMGIGGNRVLNDEIGPNALSRLDADLLTQAGVDTVILLEATNDIGIPIGGKDWLPPNVALTVVSAEEIIAGYQQIIRRAHGAGIRIFGATLAPWGKSTYDTADNETKRQTVNDWIRTSGAFDAVIDFDAAVRDSQTPTQLQAAFDSGDHLHPNDAGYSAMAQVIDLRLFRRPQLRTIGR